MVFFKAQKLQRLAELLQRVQGEIERAAGEPGDGTSGARGAGGRRSAFRVEEGLAEVARRAGLDLEVARVADPGTLERVLAPAGQPPSGRCWVVAELLFLDALRAGAEGRDDEARALLEKARSLYGHVGGGLELPEGAALPGERIDRIDELLDG